MPDRRLSSKDRRGAQQGTPWIDVACVVAVLLAVGLLLVFVVLNWSGGSSRFLG